MAQAKTHVAQLVKGETYFVQGIKFNKGQSVEVDKDLADYLKDNEQFKVQDKKTADAEQKKADQKTDEK